MRSLWSRLAWLATVLALAVPAAAAPLHRIVAVGDLHGDFSAWRDILRSASLVDNNGHWTGGDTVLIQTGDAVDRGPNSLEIIQDLMRLQKEAARAHGQVIAMVGNHEAMNLTGDLRYVSAADYAGYADRRSASRRENVYNSNKTAIETAYRAKRPADERRRDQEGLVRRLPTRAHRAPDRLERSRRDRSMGREKSCCRPAGRHAVRAWRHQSGLCRSDGGGDQCPRRSRADGAKHRSYSDHQ